MVINMRELLFRGQTRKYGQYVNMAGEKLPGNWVYGGIFQGTGDYSIIYGAEKEHFTGVDLDKYVVYSDTVGQYTGMTEFVVTDKSFNKPLFEGDIVEVWGFRGVRGYKQSKYDGEVKVRAVICFDRGEWQLDYDNAYNNALCELRGNEQDERIVNKSHELYYFGYHCSNEDWHREHNQLYKWGDIVKIGNIYDNPELLEGSAYD